MQSSINEELAPWRSVKALAEVLNSGAESKTFSEWSLRYYLASRDENGLNQYVRQVGKKLLISEPGFRRWIEQHAEIERSRDS